ncbi:hypothetical protein CRENBAI_007520 [Crenichthys baileyi]|uniref:Uncharacterized protein n=1 Tax=Crenichthys baileyi TaxID=28760 RepID=A0AAV9SMC0_9TELE
MGTGQERHVRVSLLASRSSPNRSGFPPRPGKGGQDRIARPGQGLSRHRKLPRRIAATQGAEHAFVVRFGRAS